MNVLPGPKCSLTSDRLPRELLNCVYGLISFLQKNFSPDKKNVVELGGSKKFLLLVIKAGINAYQLLSLQDQGIFLKVLV
jgi:hypothetical protein